MSNAKKPKRGGRNIIIVRDNLMLICITMLSKRSSFVNLERAPINIKKEQNYKAILHSVVSGLITH